MSLNLLLLAEAAVNLDTEAEAHLERYQMLSKSWQRRSNEYDQYAKFHRLAAALRNIVNDHTARRGADPEGA